MVRKWLQWSTLFMHAKKKQDCLYQGSLSWKSQAYCWGNFPREPNIPIGRVAASIVLRI
jgi:hypothetical protein